MKNDENMIRYIFGVHKLSHFVNFWQKAKIHSNKINGDVFNESEGNW